MISKRCLYIHKVKLICYSLSATCISHKLRWISLFIKCSIMVTDKEAWSSTVLRCQCVHNVLKFLIELNWVQVFKSCILWNYTSLIHLPQFNICNTCWSRCEITVNFTEVFFCRRRKNRQFLIVTDIKVFGLRCYTLKSWLSIIECLTYLAWSYWLKKLLLW